jgi:hypothetical protein
MSMEKIRSEFEAWECDADQGPQTDPVWLMYDAKTNTYPLDKIQARWEVWQASREALVIDLSDLSRCFSPSDCGDWAMWLDDVRIMVQAAGLKVKL